MMLPEMPQEDIEFLHAMQEKTSLKILFEKYEGRNAYYRKRTAIIEKYDVTFKLNIFYPALGLTRYFVLSKYKFESNYLVQSINFYLPQLKYLFQFAIPSQYEHDFVDQIATFDPEAEIYQADEVTLPHYNFRLLSNDVPHEQRLWNWMALLQKGVFPEIQKPVTNQVEFDYDAIHMLNYKVNGLSRGGIMEKMSISDKRDYGTMVKKLEKRMYEDIISVNTIKKMLMIIKKPVKKYDNLTLIKSFYELFIYSHNFQVVKKYPKGSNTEDNYGILSIIMSPTPHVPLFHDMICNLFEFHVFLTLIDVPEESFNLNEVYNQVKENWNWDKQDIQIIQ